MGVAPYYLNDIYNPAISHLPVLYWSLEVLAWIVLPCVVVGYGLRRGWITSEALGMHSRLFGSSASLPSVLGAVALICVLVVGYRAVDWELTEHYAHNRVSGVADQAEEAAPAVPPSPTTTPSPSTAPVPPSIAPSPSIPNERPRPSPSSTSASKSAYSISADTESEQMIATVPKPTPSTKSTPATQANYWGAPAKQQADALLLALIKALYWSLTAGIVEEIYFRGWLRRLMRGSLGMTLAYVGTSSILFSLIHWGQGEKQLIATGIFGLMCAVAYLGVRNLWPLIAAHVIVDVTFFWNGG